MPDDIKGALTEDREVLLGHANHSMAGHYASADVGRLLNEANLVLNRNGTQTLLRIAEGCRGRTQPCASLPRLEGGGSGSVRQVDDSQGAGRDRWIRKV
jgi:hypothetical protein